MAAGAPKGNKNNVKNRPWAEAIDKALKQCEDGKPEKLRALADKLISLALDGESWAMKELGDRVDGKPLAAIEMSGIVDVREHRGLPEVSDRVDDLLGRGTDRHTPGTVTH